MFVLFIEQTDPKRATKSKHKSQNQMAKEKLLELVKKMSSSRLKQLTLLAFTHEIGSWFRVEITR